MDGGWCMGAGVEQRQTGKTFLLTQRTRQSCMVLPFSEQPPTLSQASVLFSASAAGSRAAGMPAPLLAVALHNLPTVTDGTSQVPLTSLPRTGLRASPVFHPSTPKLLCASQRTACTGVGAVSSGDTGSEEKGQREKERENSLQLSALSEDQTLENLPGYMSLPGPAFRPLVAGTSLQSHR